MSAPLLEQAIRGLALANAEVAAAVGTRFYAELAPDSAARPLIVYQRISSPRGSDLAGPSGYATARIQCACISNRFETGAQLAHTLRRALDGWSGVAPPGVRIHNTRVDDIRSNGFDESTRDFEQLVDVLVDYQEV